MVITLKAVSYTHLDVYKRQVNAVSNVIKILESIPKDHLHIVWGMMADKDIDGILSLLPKDAIYYFCSPKVPRALDFMLLNEKAKNFNYITHCIYICLLYTSRCV